MASSQKVPVIGTIFSSDSSDSDTPRRTAKTSASESDSKKKVVLKVNLTSGDEATRTKLKAPMPQANEHIQIDKTRIGTLRHNTLIQYEKNDGKIVKSKYFKKTDTIANTIIVGFYPHNKRNYSESLSNIKAITVSSKISGGDDALKDTIELPKDQWKTIRRDMIVSYMKENKEYVYKARFNTFIKKQDGSTNMSLTSERGFSYVANPDKIVKIFRHVTSNDKTLTYILEFLQKLDSRLKFLESKLLKKSK